MIIGVGIDLVDIDRIQKLLDRPLAERFLQRILSAEERRIAASRVRRGREGQEVQYSQHAEYVAGRFAAKEAIVKAFGCGIGSAMGFQDIEIISDPLGKPCCTISAAALERLGAPHNINIHLSITHTATIAAAYVVIETSG